MKKLKYLFTCLILLSTQNLIAMPTLGGMQFWNDIYCSANYKIQKNVITGHCRVLKDNYLRETFGSEEKCKNYLKNLNLNNSPKKLYLIHGLGRSHWSMSKTAKHFSALGYQVHSINYASLFQNSKTSAGILTKLINSNDKNTNNYFITHSNGGILFRAISPNISYQSAALLACPNQGSQIIDFLKKYHLHHLTGPNGRQLASDSELIKNLPQAQNTISIAGDGQATFFNPPLGFMFNQANDGIVAVKNTHLANPSQNYTVKASHTFIMNSPDTWAIIDKHFKQ